MTITGLQPNTTYHWRPLTTDTNGNMAAFYDQSFHHTRPISEVAKLIDPRSTRRRMPSDFISPNRRVALRRNV